jgi:Tetracyclin repressor-like, C-terminal domain
MAAASVDQTGQEQQLRIKVLTALLTLSTIEPRLAEAATAGIGPWIAATRTLLQRAVDRGEFPPADVDTVAQVIPMMCIARAVQQQPITREFGLALIDGVIIPAMRGGR